MGELYSERMRLIRWFAANAPNKFDLFGSSWDEPRRAAGSWWQRHVTYRGPWAKTLFPAKKLYRGPVAAKGPVMGRYRFALCFENADNLPGYITEKIFDCMMAGCVPVYLGAPNVAEHIPEGCYVPHQKRSAPWKLLGKLEAVSEAEHDAYLDRIEEFFRGEASIPFTIKHYVETFGGEILASLADA